MVKCKVCCMPIWEFDGVVENDTIKIYEEDGTLDLLCDYSDFSTISMEAYAGAAFYKVGDKWGFFEVESGKVITEPLWDYVDEFHYGLAVVASGNFSVSCKDILGQIVPYDFEGKFGCIYPSGEIAIPLEYDFIAGDKYNGEGVVRVRKDDLRGIVNWDNEIVIPLKYSRVDIVSEHGVLCREPEGTYSFLYEGKEIFTGARDIYLPRHGARWESYRKGTFLRGGYSVSYSEGGDCIICGRFQRSEGNNTYYIACKGRKYAVISSDGRMITDFSLLARDAVNLVNVLHGVRYRIRK